VIALRYSEIHSHRLTVLNMPQVLQLASSKWWERGHLRETAHQRTDFLRGE
jgi:hypothetical protein